jgi:hypothetical protein
MQQKLVTVALSEITRHGLVEDHLADLLRAGWRVLSLVPVGAGFGDGFDGSSPQGCVQGWLAVLLEKQG